jgi:hypothetical protein|tara:strand:+ start:336 stop:635 length:300 start_codon:yes stop_codon:yes gene_type:complete
MKVFGFIHNLYKKLFQKIKKSFMAFKAGNLEIRGEVQEQKISSTSSETTQVELSEKELEFILVTIKNGLFKGEYVETLYNLTLKLQKHFVNLRTKNINL